MAVFFVPVYLFFGNVFIGVPLTVLTWIFAAIAFAGLGYQLLKRTISYGNLKTIILHPIVVLPLLTIAMAVMMGDLIYLPYPGDEVASWLRHARQIFLADAYWSDKVIYHLGSYTNGWPLMVAFSNIFEGQYSDRNGIVFLFLMHVGVLGFVFDLTYFVAGRSGINKSGQALYIAWILVLVLLAVEASWVLFPTFQSIEKPLLYAYLTGFLLALAAQYEEFDRWRLAAFLGFVFLTGYLVKVAFILFAPMLGIIWLVFYGRSYLDQTRKIPEARFISARLVKYGIGWAVLMLAPAAIAMLTWSHLRIGEHCFATPWEYLTSPEQLMSENSMRIARVVTDAAITYSGQFKLPLTAAGAAVLIAGLTWKRVRWFVVMIAAFVIFFMIAAHLAYNSCYSPFGETGLQSFQRYFRPNLRFIHFFGIIIAVFFLLEKFGKSDIVSSTLKKPWVGGIMTLIVVLLLGFQVWQVNRSLIDINSRHLQSDYAKTAILVTKQESERLLRIIKTRKLKNPKVSVIAQGGFGVEFNLAKYFGIKTRRNGDYFNYTPVKPYSWGEEKTNSFMHKTTPEDLVSWWKEFDVIWPIKTDQWAAILLSGLINDPECRRNPNQFFLFNTGGGTFTCISKRHPEK